MQKIMNLLGIAQRARQVVSGELAVEKFVQSGKAKLLIVAEDVSEGTRKSYMDMAKFYHVQLISILSKEDLGAAIGKYNRAAVALSDPGFIKALIKLIDMNGKI